MQLSNSVNQFLECSTEVREAIETGNPVVALESTLIAHGISYPQNLEVAARVESEVRRSGAIPATIAVIGGKMKAGINQVEMEFLAKGTGVMKLSRRDLPWAMVRKMTGATTVASTMIIARQAGIRIFATGGIGGVHRGVETSGDVSADLPELSRTQVVVVSAGAKAILDLPKTLEFLETWGVPVVGYRTREFPAFYSRSSGLPLEMMAQEPDEIAAFIRTKWEAGLEGGILVANPIPEESEIKKEEIEPFITRALMEANELQIQGKDLTPFLLNRLSILTSGRSVQANTALVIHNARLAAEIAVAL